MSAYIEWINYIIDSNKDTAKIVMDSITALRYFPFVLETIEIPKREQSKVELAVIYASSNLDRYIRTPLSPMTNNYELNESSIIGKQVYFSLWCRGQGF